MPGRLRTASRPFSTLMLSAPYSSGTGFSLSVMGSESGHFQSEFVLAERGYIPKQNGLFLAVSGGFSALLHQGNFAMKFSPGKPVRPAPSPSAPARPAPRTAPGRCLSENTASPARPALKTAPGGGRDRDARQFRQAAGTA